VSAGVGVRIDGDVTRCSFIGGFCDQNLLGGFVLEGNCTAIKIIGMEIFENGTTTTNQPGIKITSTQNALGWQGKGGIQIANNNIFDLSSGLAGEKQAVGIDISTSGSTTDISITGNGLRQSSTPIATLSNLRAKAAGGIHISDNVGVLTELSGITTATIDIGSTGIKTISAIDVSALTEDLHPGSIIHLTFTAVTNVDFDAVLIATNNTSGSTFDIRANVTTASAAGS